MNKNILVKGYFKGNLGDDLFLKTLTERFPSENFEIIIDPKFKKNYVYFKNLKVINKNLIYKLINKAMKLFSKGGIYALILPKYKAIVEIGGSIFPERKDFSDVTPERRYLSEHIKHYFVLGSNFGPYRTEHFRKKYESFFYRIEGTVFRDRKSFTLFNNLDNTRYAPDIVLSLDREKVISEPYVGISVIDLNYDDISRGKSLKNYQGKYELAIIQSVLDFIDQGFKIKFIPFSESQNDKKISKKLKREILQKRFDADIEIVDDNDLNKKIEIIKGCSYLLSTRYHAMILGWVFGIKQHVFIYSDKTKNVIKDIFPAQYATDIDSNEPYKLSVDKMNTIEEYDKIHREAEQQFYYLDRFLRNNR